MITERDTRSRSEVENLAASNYKDKLANGPRSALVNTREHVELHSQR